MTPEPPFFEGHPVLPHSHLVARWAGWQNKASHGGGGRTEGTGEGAGPAGTAQSPERGGKMCHRWKGQGKAAEDDACFI